MDDADAWSLFANLVQDFARADVPPDVFQALRLGRMTALKKDNGRARGIVAGSVLRRLACKAVAQQFADKLLAATAPWQFALSTKAGTEALAHAVRLLLETDDSLVVVSLDGVGAFDHIKRAGFMKQLHANPELQQLLPLVTALYGSTSRFLWRDAAGKEHVVEQAEGGE